MDLLAVQGTLKSLSNTYCTGLYIIMMALSVLFAYLFPGSTESASSDLLGIWNGQSFVILIISSALFPAICEEIAFRGFFFGTLKNRMKIVPAIIFTGIIFGAFHMNFIKLFVVGLLGAVLAYCVYRSGSILTSMWMHFLNNSMAVIIAWKSGITNTDFDSYASTETEMLENLGTSNVIMIVIAGLLFTAVGFIWFEYIGKARSKKEADSLKGQESDEQYRSGETDDKDC